MTNEPQFIDVAWLLICTVLVLLMQAGFVCLESGLVRSKNSINVAFKNFADFLVSSAIFWVAGFAIMFGSTYSGLVGRDGFFFSAPNDAWLTTFFLFQLMFCGTATTIVSGAVAERMRFVGYLVVSAITAGLIYPVVGHWVWGGAQAGAADGWLAAKGFIDFAGTTVVHSVGGWVSLAAVLVIGPRLGRFGKGSVTIHGHDLPMVTLGIFLLWFGWFGFNGGSTLGFNEKVPSVLINTMVSGVFGGLATMAISWFIHRRPDVAIIMNGGLAGLVGITGSAHIMTPDAALLIGLTSGIVMVGGTLALEALEIDDVVGAFPVHGCCGVWGTLVIPLIGDPENWGTGLTRWEQFGVQLQGAGACFLYAFGLTFILLKLINRLLPLRIDPDGERKGLNVAEHGASTEILDLLEEMDDQRRSGDFTTRVSVEPHTEIGQIATQYNRVLDGINEESGRREAALAALGEKTKSLQLLQHIAAATNDATTISRAMRIAVEGVCDHIGWPVGHVFLMDEQGSDDLLPTNIWRMDDERDYGMFRWETSRIRVQRDHSLPGRVLNGGKAVWIADIGQEEHSERANAAASIGLKGAMAIPVLIGDEVVAVLEFFTPDSAQPDDTLLDLMHSVGLQLGRAIERKRAEEHRFRAVVDNLPALVFLRDFEGRFILVNRAYREFYHLDDTDLRGKKLEEVFSNHDLEAVVPEWKDLDRKALELAKPITAETVLMRDGNEYDFFVARFPIQEIGSRIVGIGGIEVDISEQKSVERALEQAVKAKEAAIQELSAVLDTIDYGILFLDEKLIMRNSNRAYREMWERPNDFQEIGCSLREGMDESFKRGMYRIGKDGWSTYADERIERIKRGSVEPTELGLANGKTIQYQCIDLENGGRMLTYFDITAHKNHEQQILAGNQRLKDTIKELQRSRKALEDQAEQLYEMAESYSVEKDRAQAATLIKSKFLANMSHELRTPLNAIIGFTRLVMRRSKDSLPQKQYENLEKVLISAEQLLELINSILDLSKIEAGRMTVSPVEFDPDAVTDECLRMIEPILFGKRIELVRDFQHGLPRVFTDREKFRQILMNLLSNAAKFTEQGSIAVEIAGKDDALRIEVTDTGIGIPEEAMDVVFEEFNQVDDSNTRRHGGTGLGLSITKQLVELLGGRISVQSRFGQGSVFTVELPAHYSESDYDEIAATMKGTGAPN